jgi:hypothetical protein
VGTDGGVGGILEAESTHMLKQQGTAKAEASAMRRGMRVIMVQVVRQCVVCHWGSGVISGERGRFFPVLAAPGSPSSVLINPYLYLELLLLQFRKFTDVHVVRVEPQLRDTSDMRAENIERMERRPRGICQVFEEERRGDVGGGGWHVQPPVDQSS